MAGLPPSSLRSKGGLSPCSPLCGMRVAPIPSCSPPLTSHCGRRVVGEGELLELTVDGPRQVGGVAALCKARGRITRAPTSGRAAPGRTPAGRQPWSFHRRKSVPLVAQLHCPRLDGRHHLLVELPPRNVKSRALPPHAIAFRHIRVFEQARVFKFGHNAQMGLTGRRRRWRPARP
jgi:hypothetical protein